MGFCLAAPVGPIAALCVQRTIAKRWISGLVSGMGAAVADALYGDGGGVRRDDRVGVPDLRAHVDAAPRRRDPDVHGAAPLFDEAEERGWRQGRQGRREGADGGLPLDVPADPDEPDDVRRLRRDLHDDGDRRGARPLAFDRGAGRRGLPRLRAVVGDPLRRRARAAQPLFATRNWSTSTAGPASSSSASGSSTCCCRSRRRRAARRASGSRPATPRTPSCDASRRRTACCRSRRSGRARSASRRSRTVGRRRRRAASGRSRRSGRPFRARS